MAGFCRSRSPLDRPAPLREVRALSGEPWIHPYDLVTTSRHFVRQGPLPGHPDPSGIPGATGGHPLNRAGTGPCFSKHFLRLLAYSAPLLHPLWLPVSSLCLHPDHHHSRPPAHLWPLESGLLALSPACLCFVCSAPPWLLLTILNPFLCFQDFRKYEEGFDPYSMVRGDSPAWSWCGRGGGREREPFQN